MATTFDAHKNLAVSTVATAPVTPTAGTTLIVAAGEGARFPAVPFNATTWPVGTIPTPLNAEIVRVTAISTDTFTIVRAQEGTTAMPVSITAPGYYIAETITAKILTDVEAAINARFEASNGILSGVAGATYSAGKLVFDTDNDCLTFFNSDSGISLQVGQEFWVRVKNSTGSTIANGAAVYVNGTDGANNMPTIALAKADAAATAKVAGVTTEAILNGAVGFVTSVGLIHNLNTSGFTAGVPLYLSAATAGLLTATAPTSPNLAILVGNCLTSNATTGAISVTPVGQIASSSSPATFTAAGTQSATDKIAQNSMDGRTSTGTNIRVFRPGDYMVGNTFDPTGAADSTSAFAAMKAAIVAFNDRYVIQLSPGVFKVDNTVFTGLPSGSGGILGPGRGNCVFVTTGAGKFITLPPAVTGSDGFTVKGFTIYNTSGTPYASGAGISTNACDNVLLEELGFIDLFDDVDVTGEGHVMTTAGTTALTGVSPVFVAGDVGKVISGPGIIPGTTLNAQAGATGTLSAAASISSTATRYLNNTIKCSIQKTVHYQTNGNASSVGILVSNGLAGDTYIGPDVVMSNSGATRRRASVEIQESGHYELTQNNLTGSAQGILIDPLQNQIVAFGFHQQVLADSCSVNGMTLSASTATSTIKNIKSDLSWYSGTITGGGAGMVTSGTAGGIINGVTFSNDRFLNNQTHGAQHGFGTDFRFDSCDMKGNSAASANTSDGLNVAAAVSNWSVSSGKYGGTDTAVTGNQRYGIFVAAGAGDNINIQPADLSGNSTGPISLGATGVMVGVSWCPGLANNAVRTTVVGTTSTQFTQAKMLIPKNSVRVGTSLSVKYRYQGSSTGIPTFQVRCGTTNETIDAAATNGVVVSAAAAAGVANAWGSGEFILTFTAVGAAGSLAGSGGGSQASAGYSTATAARASGAGFLAIDTTSDKYLSLSAATAAGTLTFYNATIEVVNY